MNWKAVPRKKRKHPAILRDGPLFSKAFHERDFEKASKIVFRTALEVMGVKGILNAFHNANSFLKRQKYRKGL